MLRAVAGLVPYRGDHHRRRRAAVGPVAASPRGAGGLRAAVAADARRHDRRWSTCCSVATRTSATSAARPSTTERWWPTCCDRLDLDEFADRRLGTLSGGERQRLVIARALAQEAPILLLDEPTSALDIGHQQQALELVDRLRREHGLTVVSAMHDLTLAGLYADRLALLHQGHVVATGDAAHVLRPETLSEFYGVSVSVHHEPDGTVVVVPRRSPA